MTNLLQFEDTSKRLDFLRNYTIDIDRRYKLGEISRVEWLGERDSINQELDLIEIGLKKELK